MVGRLSPASLWGPLPAIFSVANWLLVSGRGENSDKNQRIFQVPVKGGR